MNQGRDGGERTTRKLRHALNVWVCMDPANHGVVVAITQFNRPGGAMPVHGAKIQRGEPAAAVLAFSFVEVSNFSLP